MSVKDDVKILLAKEAMTMTKLAEKMAEASGKPYTMKSISDKLARQTLQYREFTLILDVLKYKMELKKL